MPSNKVLLSKCATMDSWLICYCVIIEKMLLSVPFSLLLLLFKIVYFFLLLLVLYLLLISSVWVRYLIVWLGVDHK